MRLTFSLIEKAVDLATRVFVTVRDAGSNNAAAESTHLVSLIDDVSKRIDSVASDFAANVASQMERQQLEKLSAQAKVVKLALEIGNDSMLGSAVASISEQIEYSRMRLAENKHEWFGPWMIAEAVRIEALRIMANNPRGIAVVERETVNFRINILNHVGALLIGATENPWVQIADFVEGRNENVLQSLAQVKVLQMPEVTEASTKAPASVQSAPVAATSVIAPAAWPFPTSGRP
jgi:hypothetical protein